MSQRNKIYLHSTKIKHISIIKTYFRYKIKNIFTYQPNKNIFTCQHNKNMFLNIIKINIFIYQGTKYIDIYHLNKNIYTAAI